MRIFIAVFFALVVFATFVNKSHAEVAALGLDSFVVVEQLGDSSQKITYYTISNDKISLKDMIIVKNSLDNRISKLSSDIYVQIDKLKEIQNK